MDPDMAPISMIPERMIIFIDARNILKSQIAFNNARADSFMLSYYKLISFFANKYSVIRGYFYDGAPHVSQRTSERVAFFNELPRLGITLRLKEIDYSSKHLSQKGVDIYLATDMISLAYEDAYDIAVILSGDGDYVALIDLVKSKGKKVWVMSFRDSLSVKLRECADKVLLIDNMVGQFRKEKVSR